MFHGIAQIGILGNLHPTMGIAMFQSSVGTGNAGQQFFQNLWTLQAAPSGAVGTLVGSGGAISVAAYSILSVILIVGVYEAFARGGAMRDLIVLMAKVAVCGLLIATWSTFFTDITTNGSFALANSIGGSDFYTNLQAAITAMQNIQYGSMSLTNLGQDSLELVNAIAIGIAMIIYWVAYYLMIFAFTAWGLILMAIGPLLVATIPSSLVSSYGSTYIKGLVQWLSWPILYSVMGVLVTGLQSDTTWSANPAAFSNMNNLTIAGVTVTYSVAVMFIPWLAQYIINGSFSGAASIVTGVMGAMGGTAMGAFAGGAGLMSSGGGGGGSAAGSGGGAAGGGGGETGGGGGGGGATGGGSGGGGKTVTSPSPTPPATSSSGSGSGGGGGSVAPNSSSPSPSPSTASSSGGGGGGNSGSHGGSSGGGGGMRGAIAGAMMGASGGVSGVVGQVGRHMANTHSGGDSAPAPAPKLKGGGTLNGLPVR
jgi:hypothetical protein